MSSAVQVSVAVSAQGYAPVQTAVDVTAGQVVSVPVALEAAAVPAGGGGLAALLAAAAGVVVVAALAAE